MLHNKEVKTLKLNKTFMQTIMSLSYENISFNFPLESDEKNKLWLEFICFIFRLKLLSQKYNYNIFKRHYIYK